VWWLVRGDEVNVREPDPAADLVGGSQMTIVDGIKCTAEDA